MRTSCFVKQKSNFADCVSISLYQPRWMENKIQEYPALASTRWMLHNGYTEDDYRSIILYRLNPAEIYYILKGKILLCHEKDPLGCHRRMVARWIEDCLGIEVPEIGEGRELFEL